MPVSVGDALLSGFFQVLFDRLAPLQLPQFVLEDEVHSELSKWWTTLSMIHAVLNDAEGKQLTDMAVKMWLYDLRHLAYDVEDVLDEFATEALRRKCMTQGSTSNVHSLIPSCLTNCSPSAIKFNLSIGSKKKDISNRLERLCKQRVDLGLEKVAEPKFTAAWQRPLTTCLPTEPKVFGRHDDVAKILKMLLDEDTSYPSSFGVIPIVGMAGVGKTTLARMVYNDTSVVKCFNLRAWVCVSDDFNVLRVSKAILESITHSSCDLKDINEVQVQLQEKLSRKRYLFVLDDVWIKSYDLWEMLKSPLMAGLATSKVIVTTRRGDIALTVGQPAGCYHMKLLSNDDCWSVFKMHADEFLARPNIDLFAKKVVEKCEGLPLVARTLGGLLRSKERDDEWEDILSCKIWDLPEESNILPVLILSYYHLPSHLKQCFIYCAIFPKYYVFEEKKLISLWMAEGLIQPAKNNKQLEDIGNGYIRDLLSKSIFKKTGGDASQFTMHNLFIDLAQWISGESAFKVEDGLAINIQSPRFNRVRHFSCNDPTYKFEDFIDVKRLRTFLPIFARDVESTITNRILDMLPRLKKLRVLSLRGFSIAKLPKSIFKDLRYLRYLDLGGTNIMSLPKSTSLSFNLQTLILRHCYFLVKLPSKLKNLINLRHLDIRGVRLIRWMPSGMHNLKKLHTLSNFIVGRDIGSCLIDLKDLEFLSGEFCVSQLENMTRRELTGAVLIDKQYLKVLVLDFGSDFDNSRNMEAEKDVLEKLQPHRNVTNLAINHYGGSYFPSWVGDPSFSNMVVLRIVGCKKLTSLPSLGVLRSLKDLTVSGLNDLRIIGQELLESSYSNYFPSLENLHLENLPKWHHWEHNDLAQNFQCLRELSIINFPKLSRSLPGHLPSLQKLKICQCAELAFLTSSFPMLLDLIVNGCKEMVYTPAAHDFGSIRSMTPSIRLRQGFRKAERLRIEKCPTLTSLLHVIKHDACLDHLVIKGCHSLTNIVIGHLPSTLKRLEMRDCDQFLCLLGDGEGEGTTNLSSAEISPSSLEHLCISDCPASSYLVSRGQLPNTLNYLEIRNCSQLVTLVSSGQLPKKLKHLEVSNCQNLGALSSGGPLPESLEHLYVYDCPITRLQTTDDPLPASLQHLNIQFCTQLETLAFGQFPAGLKCLKINSCDKLVSLPEGMQNLGSHCEVEIDKCQGLVSILQNGLPIRNEIIVSANASENLTSLPSSGQYQLS